MPDRHQPEWIQPPEQGSELDALLRSSIASYGEPAPNSELAQRILIRIAAEPEQAAPRRWLPWAIALPVAACLITFFILFEARPVHAPAGIANQAQIPAPLHNYVAADESHPVQHENKKTLIRPRLRLRLAAVGSEPEALPKLDVFPTPQPLTPAERALADFAASASTSERKALIEQQQKSNTPLTIAAIKIQPIEMPELGN
jgi:hypothetical protein